MYVCAQLHASFVPLPLVIMIFVWTVILVSEIAIQGFVLATLEKLLERLQPSSYSNSGNSRQFD